MYTVWGPREERVVGHTRLLAIDSDLLPGYLQFWAEARYRAHLAGSQTRDGLEDPRGHCTPSRRLTTVKIVILSSPCQILMRYVWRKY